MKTLTFDCETTGLPPKNGTYQNDFMSYPHIVTLAWKIDGGESKEFIINQEGREIPVEASNIHGITTEIANASPHYLLPILEMMLMEGKGAKIVVGHNIYFDSSTIKANVLRMIKEARAIQAFYDDFEELLHKDRRIDTMKGTVNFCALPGRYGFKWPKLTELHEKLFPGETFDAHNSKSDVDATHRCWLKLLELGILKVPTPREIVEKPLDEQQVAC